MEIRFRALETIDERTGSNNCTSPIWYGGLIIFGPVRGPKLIGSVRELGPKLGGPCPDVLSVTSGPYCSKTDFYGPNNLVETKTMVISEFKPSLA